VEQIRGLSGVLLEDPRELAGGRGMGRLALGGTVGSKGIRATARGTVLVFFPPETLSRLRDFGRGAALYVEGSFTESTGEKRAFTDGTPLFRARTVHIVRPAPEGEGLRTGIRLAILDKLSPRSWGGLAAALLLGVRDTLDSELARAYQNAGCSHVLALSGMHLAIVASIVAFFLRKPLGFKAAALTGAALIVLYTVLVGAQPSLERAAIMYLLGTAGILGALPRQPLPLLAMAFLIQITLRPSSGDSLSFILSYLALGGILTAGETLGGILRGRLPEFLIQPLAASLGASLSTAAVTTAAFGMVRPVGILAGLIIVPLTTLFMIGAMAALALDFLAPFLTVPLDQGLSLLYALMGRLVSLAAAVPGLSSRGWGAALLISLGMAVLCVGPGNRHILRRQNLVPFD
jgi:competence protein ComEC